MAQISTYLQPVRFRVLFISKLPCPAFPLFRNFGHVKVWMNRIHSPAIPIAAPSTSSFRLYFRRFLQIPNSIRISGKISKGSIIGGSVVLGLVSIFPRISYSVEGKISKGSIIGGSVVLGLVSIFPRISYSVEGFQFLLDNHTSFSGNFKFKEEKLSFLAFAKKFMLALFAIATVLTNMDHPVKLAAKLIVALLSSKPSPSSVYFIIEQCRHQYMRQNPLWYKIKPLYAKQVKVQDYKLMFVARVELHDQKFTLIGILGNWWVIQMAPCLETLSVLKNKD